MPGLQAELQAWFRAFELVMLSQLHGTLARGPVQRPVRSASPPPSALSLRRRAPCSTKLAWNMGGARRPALSPASQDHIELMGNVRDAMHLEGCVS